MKKIKFFALAAMLAAMVVTLCGCGGKREGGTLKLFIPGEYMSENFISDFEKQYDCRVIPEYFESNEMMYTKVQAGDAYDVLVPSDYMIERLLKENMLQKLDKSQIPNLSNLTEEVKGVSYDPDNTYSAPYFWGTVGIVYNNKVVSLKELEEQNFDIFKNPKYCGRIYIYDSEREGFLMALKQLGYSCNTDDDAQISEAYKWLIELAETMDADFVTDEVLDYMMNGNKDLAIAYSGDAATILAENEDMSYYMPTCGTNLWVDAMVIPANAENAELANKFINYALEKSVCIDNTLAVGYASPHAEVLAEMIAEDGEFYGNEAYLPRSNSKDEIYHDNEYLRRKMSELWIKVKAAGEH